MEHDPNPYVIFTYTRKQAIEDGVLVDIAELAKKYGFSTCLRKVQKMFNRAAWRKPAPAAIQI